MKGYRETYEKHSYNTKARCVFMVFSREAEVPWNL